MLRRPELLYLMLVLLLFLEILLRCRYLLFQFELSFAGNLSCLGFIRGCERDSKLRGTFFKSVVEVQWTACRIAPVCLLRRWGASLYGWWILTNIEKCFNFFVWSLDSPACKLLNHSFCSLRGAHRKFCLAFIWVESWTYHGQWCMTVSNLQQQSCVEVLSNIHNYNYVRILSHSLIRRQSIIGHHSLGWGHSSVNQRWLLLGWLVQRTVLLCLLKIILLQRLPFLLKGLDHKLLAKSILRDTYGMLGPVVRIEFLFSRQWHALIIH